MIPRPLAQWDWRKYMCQIFIFIRGNLRKVCVMRKMKVEAWRILWLWSQLSWTKKLERNGHKVEEKLVEFIPSRRIGPLIIMSLSRKLDYSNYRKLRIKFRNLDIVNGSQEKEPRVVQAETLSECAETLSSSLLTLYSLILFHSDILLYHPKTQCLL